MASQTLTPALSVALASDDIEETAPRAAWPWLRRLFDLIVAAQTHRAQRAIAMHIRTRGLEFRPLDSGRPPR